MGLHPSLKQAEKLGGKRSVMKRNERIKWLMKKGKWQEEDRVFGLPKIKIVKLKAIKKEKTKEEEESKEATADTTATESTKKE